MSAIPTAHGTDVRSIVSRLVSLARQALWTCVGALAARPLHAVARPHPVRIHRASRRRPSRLGDGT